MKVYFSRMNILNNICTENERNTIILFPVTELYTKLSSDAAFNILYRDRWEYESFKNIEKCKRDQLYNPKENLYERGQKKFWNISFEHPFEEVQSNL